MKEDNSDIIMLSILMILFGLAVGTKGGSIEKGVGIEKDTIFNKWRRIY